MLPSIGKAGGINGRAYVATVGRLESVFEYQRCYQCDLLPPGTQAIVQGLTISVHHIAVPPNGMGYCPSLAHGH